MGIGWINRMIGPETAKFLSSFRTLLDGYRDGSMRYGMFVSRKPG